MRGSNNRYWVLNYWSLLVSWKFVLWLFKRAIGLQSWSVLRITASSCFSSFMEISKDSSIDGLWHSCSSLSGYFFSIVIKCETCSQLWLYRCFLQVKFSFLQGFSFANIYRGINFHCCDGKTENQREMAPFLFSGGKYKQRDSKLCLSVGINEFAMAASESWHALRSQSQIHTRVWKRGINMGSSWPRRKLFLSEEPGLEIKRAFIFACDHLWHLASAKTWDYYRCNLLVTEHLLYIVVVPGENTMYMYAFAKQQKLHEGQNPE